MEALKTLILSCFITGNNFCMALFKTSKVHRVFLIKYTWQWQMVFVSPSIVHAVSRMLCEPNYVLVLLVITTATF